MFFIGIFGIQTKSETIKTESGAICPVCGAYDRYEIIKVFNYFHIFFIPVWRWNQRYFVRTRCCKQTSELAREVGERIERGERVALTEKELIHQPQAPFCSHCRARLDRDYNYCPFCGNRA